MPNGRSIDPIPILGAAIIGGAVAWLIFRKRPVPEPKFSVGQRVALVSNTLFTATVLSLTFGVSGVHAWFYLIDWDEPGLSNSLIEERFLVAIF